MIGFQESAKRLKFLKQLNKVKAQSFNLEELQNQNIVGDHIFREAMVQELEFQQQAIKHMALRQGLDIHPNVQYMDPSVRGYVV
jgi:hypothetical protein